MNLKPLCFVFVGLLNYLDAENTLLAPTIQTHSVSLKAKAAPDVSYRYKDPEMISAELNKKENFLNQSDCVYFMIESELNGERIHSAAATHPSSPLKIVNAWGKNFNPKPLDTKEKMQFWSYYHQWDNDRPSTEPFEINPQSGSIKRNKDDVNTLRKIYECCGYNLPAEETMKNIAAIDNGDFYRSANKSSVSPNCAGNIMYAFQGGILGQEWQNQKLPEKTDGKKESFWEVRSLERLLNERSAKLDQNGAGCHVIHDEITGKTKSSNRPFGYDSEEGSKSQYLPISITKAPPKEKNDYQSTLLCHLMCEEYSGKIIHLCSVNRYLGNFYNPTPVPESTKPQSPLTYRAETFPPHNITSQQKFYPEYPKTSEQIPEACKKEYDAAIANQKSVPLEMAFPEERFALFEEAYNDEQQVYYPGLSTELINYYKR